MEPAFRAEINEEEGADKITEKCEERTGHHEDHAPRNREPVELAQEKRDHKRGLQRADASARFVDADIAGADFDHVAQLHRRNSDCGENFNVDARVHPHQSLDQDLFEARRPRHCDEKEKNRERKVAQPAGAAREINSSGGNCHRTKRHRPAQQSPIRIRLLNQPDWNKHQRADNNQRRPKNARSWRGRRRRVLPAPPENVGGQDRDRPAVTVLRIDRPFEPEPRNDFEPDQRENGDGKPRDRGRLVLDFRRRRRGDSIHAWVRRELSRIRAGREAAPALARGLLPAEWFDRFMGAAVD